MSRDAHRLAYTAGTTATQPPAPFAYHPPETWRHGLAFYGSDTIEWTVGLGAGLTLTFSEFLSTQTIFDRRTKEFLYADRFTKGPT